MNYLNGIGNVNSLSGGQDSIAPANAGRLSRTGMDTSTSTAQAGVSGNVETTTLSATAGMLAGALSGSDVRMDRVSALQQSIGAGAYNVPASDVAAKLLGALLN